MTEEQDDVQVLREILARELETINNYQNLLGRARSAEVAAFIDHIIDEEKEHVAESMTLINRIDERQALRFANSDHWRENSEAIPANKIEETESQQLITSERFFTVGSLRNTKTD